MWNNFIVCAAFGVMLAVVLCLPKPDLAVVRKLAVTGDVNAQVCLGRRYAGGTGGAEEDKIESAKWFHRAAEQGNPDAQYRLGLCFFKGEGVVRDAVEAYKWLLLAAISGDKAAGGEYSEMSKVMTVEQIAEAQARAKKWQLDKAQSRTVKIRSRSTT